MACLGSKLGKKKRYASCCCCSFSFSLSACYTVSLVSFLTNYFSCVYALCRAYIHAFVKLSLQGILMYRIYKHKTQRRERNEEREKNARVRWCCFSRSYCLPLSFLSTSILKCLFTTKCYESIQIGAGSAVLAQQQQKKNITQKSTRINITESLFHRCCWRCCAAIRAVTSLIMISSRMET